jgi:hypothetical protein
MKQKRNWNRPVLKNACVTRCANGRLSVESFDTPASEIYRIANLDAILDAIPRSSEEDMSGYHHYFHFEDLEVIFRKSATFDAVLDQLARIPFGAHFV